MTEASRTTGTSRDSGILNDRGSPAGPGMYEIPGSRIAPAYTGSAGTGAPGRMVDLFRTNNIPLGPDEAVELELFEEFLMNHVVRNRNCDVQCMLLWNEWVRNFRRRTSSFPRLIGEKMFRSSIKGLFGIDIDTDGWRGSVFTGVHFVH